MMISRGVRSGVSVAKYARRMATNPDNSPTVVLQEVGNAGIITLDRQKALNAINLDMVRQIYPALKKFDETKSLIIIKGAGEKAFCAGGDVHAIAFGDFEKAKAFFHQEYTVNATIQALRKPYVALIDGITMGGGVGLSVHGRYRVATEKTLFAMPETAIGLFPDVGGGYFLPRLRGKLGMFLGLTGVRLKGRDVEKSGVATHFCDSKKIPELEAELCKCSSDQEVSQTLAKFCPKDSTEFVLEKYMSQINECFSGATVEEILQRLRKDNSEWAQGILKTLAKMSPTSMKVSKKQIDLGAKLTLPECLLMEYRLAVRHAQDSDLKEGVRALLVDRDNQPKWNPATLEAVTDEHVDAFFKPLEEELKL
ncbi:3-hydroxyisobutyryl-CoA hydrolase, mitochondrial isoform X2 [Phlebotomus argentipes]|uniref:3-hydroxyisobutyryl-CoA hydrolase, mitochondrial isoform X2 n=1 Tax=Phlebotomus argentipes TaxID=94469 RepID=UPI00289377F4|nr:3-hydroxyisobutyryl-CoA hydrolase, mitochondrial isoform X2 [Phlebotomus argentipes]